MSKLSANEAWKIILDKYDIVDKVNKDGFFEIKAAQIKEFKEPRLMAKWDSSESLPGALKSKNLNILPNSRSSYIISDFKLYQGIPELTEHITKMQKVEVPEFESINIKNITTESNAINVLQLSNILDDFLLEDDNVSTFNGRMGTGIFSFNVDRHRGIPIKINVQGAQCEIDGGMENDNSVVIIEAKNVVYSDFHIRQLYYPYRLWKTKVNKPIRLVFSIYSNQIYRLLEYEFTELKNYSSIVLVKEKNYSLQDTDITNEDLLNVFRNTKVEYTDNLDDSPIAPFVQANSFERVISLLEVLATDNKTKEEVADIMQFNERQSDYYFNAGKYLGMFEKISDVDELGDRKTYMKLTTLGSKIYDMPYKKRQLALVWRILQHQIFNDLFKTAFDSGIIPDKKYVVNKMKELNVCEKSMGRRSSSVIAWLNWIFSLTNI